jgi:hypothetical protein
MPALTLHCLRRGAVARVAGVVASGVMAFVAEMVGQFAVESALDQCFGELLKEAVLTEQVFGLLVIFQ